MSKEVLAAHLQLTKANGPFRAVTSCCCCREVITGAGTGGASWLCISCFHWLPGARLEFDEMKARLEGLEK